MVTNSVFTNPDFSVMTSQICKELNLLTFSMGIDGVVILK
jgi:hypothetical protein